MDLELDDMNNVLEIKEIHSREYLPMCLQKTNEPSLQGVNDWLRKRNLPPSREGLKELHKEFGRFENYRNMFSLSDQYWFQRNTRETWDKLNFFTHTYPTAIGDAQFAPWMVTEEDLKAQSPDLTTNGVCRKQWIQDPETLDSYLLKARSVAHQQEPLSEVLTSLLLKRMNILPFVNYELTVNKLYLCSKSKCFVTRDTEFVPAKSLFDMRERRAGETSYQHFLIVCDDYGIRGAKEYLDKMIFIDALTGNNDRHWGNFGFLRNVEEPGGKLMFAPLFDFGSAFLSYGKKSLDRKSVFVNEEVRVCKNYRSLFHGQAFEDLSELYEIIDMYPDLHEDIKKDIKEGFKEKIETFILNESSRGGAKSR